MFRSENANHQILRVENGFRASDGRWAIACEGRTERLAVHREPVKVSFEAL